jgi:hypothetical protein
MELRDVTYQGPALDGATLLARLPKVYRQLLEQVNGFVKLHGGLHIRGVCTAPEWHSLSTVWEGRLVLSQHYPIVEPSDVPFGQDVVGDQFLLRGDRIYRLSAETGDLVSLGCGLMTFLEQAQRDPVGYLKLQPMLRFFNEGGRLEPGELLSVYPPFCTKESAQGVSLRAVPALERLSFLADFARQIMSLPEGSAIKIKVVPEGDS